jgi:hypothetical protein
LTIPSSEDGRLNSKSIFVELSDLMYKGISILVKVCTIFDSSTDSLTVTESFAVQSDYIKALVMIKLSEISKFADV